MNSSLISYQCKPGACILIYILLFLVVFSSCIRDEAANSEADILEYTVPDMPDDMRVGAKEITLSPGSDQINIWVVRDSEVSTLSPEFVLTKGATISPASGTTLDFSNLKEQKYIVTSEDRKWAKEYTVVVKPSYVLTADETNEKTKTFSFEHYRKFDGKYNFNQFYEISLSGKEEYIWDSGNLGFALINAVAPSEDYPTFPISEGKNGSAVKLVTRSTGAFGAMVGMPIAAGNLFLGTFDMALALSKPLEATRFGIAYTMGEPTELNFWYKFQGGTFTDKDGNTKEDYPAMYAVLYEPQIIDGEYVLLDGDNVLTADNIISIAEMSPSDVVHTTDIDTADYTYASIPFVARKEINAQKLADGDYFITVVFSSSERGKYFEGFAGSTLCIDEAKLICK